MTLPAPFKAIIFDMDGLLVDSEIVWFEAETATFAGHGVTLDPEVRNRFTGLRNDEFIDGLIQHYGLASERLSMQREVLDRMQALIPEKVQPKPGAAELIEYIKANQIPTAIASSSPERMIDTVVESHGWADVFRIRCSAEGLPRGKPAPDVYLLTAETLGIAPQHCLALEDSANGAKAAIAAGMTCYVVPDLSHSRVSDFEGVVEELFDSLHTVLYRLRGKI
ncbi:MAG: HAD family phosphatase [Anaerolineae bacterium]|nr:HAD family phosphatase [Anaerolineae bacterium]